jgi:hypothetical protein
MSATGVFRVNLMPSIQQRFARVSVQVFRQAIGSADGLDCFEPLVLCGLFLGPIADKGRRLPSADDKEDRPGGAFPDARDGGILESDGGHCRPGHL